MLFISRKTTYYILLYAKPHPRYAFAQWSICLYWGQGCIWSSEVNDILTNLLTRYNFF